MDGKEVTIEEVLYSREKRLMMQTSLIKKHNSPIISFTLNIPGPIKNNILIKNAFDYGKDKIFKNLDSHRMEILEIEELNENTGNELFIAVKSDAKTLKSIAVEIEEAEAIGRIFDIDVIDKNFEKLSRNKFRKCFICNEQAQECGRSGRHSIEILQDKVIQILKILESKK